MTSGPQSTAIRDSDFREKIRFCRYRMNMFVMELVNSVFLTKNCIGYIENNVSSEFQILFTIQLIAIMRLDVMSY